MLVLQLLQAYIIPPIAFTAIIFSIVVGIWYSSNGYLIPRSYLTAAFIGGICLTFYYSIYAQGAILKMALYLSGFITMVAIVSIIAIAAQKQHVTGDDALLAFDIGFAVVLGVVTLGATWSEYSVITTPSSAFDKWRK